MRACFGEMASTTISAMSSTSDAPGSSPPADPHAPPHREVTVAAVVTGVIVGTVMNASITYAALKIGFGIGGSTIAAIIGFGVLRGLLRKGTILETNISQTVASAVNIPNAGIVFTVPVLFMLGYDLSIRSADFWIITLAGVVGAVLGCAFIIPLRKQMIEIDRLRFPTGTAVAEILKSPGAGPEKALVLLAGCILGALFYLPAGLPQISFKDAAGDPVSLPGYGSLGWVAGVDRDGDGDHDPILSDHEFNAGLLLGFPDEILFLLAISPLSLGAGFVTGRPGLMVLAGGVLAFFVINPIAFNYLDLMPAGTAAWEVPNISRSQFNRPLGIGMLVGGAMMGVVFSLPAMKAALKSIAGARGVGGGDADELGLKPLGIAIVAGLAGLFLATVLVGGSVDDPTGLFSGLPNFVRGLLLSLIGGLWIWFAGIIIAQCTGMTDWSPISGIALLTVVVVLLLGGKQNVVGAVMIGAALCVSISCAADMIQDLKTGHLVGSSPKRQQTIELAVTGVGPIITMLIILVIVQANLRDKDNVNKVPIGEGTNTPAPQAEALKAVIQGVGGLSKEQLDERQAGAEVSNEPTGKEMPYSLYGFGALLGALMGFGGFPGLGVLVGLSMYLPINYILTYGIGCLIYMVVARIKGKVWAESWGVPFCAGLIVGEAITSIVISGIVVATSG
ncbi:MAG: peptide transporter [Planctomycetota bacterium]|nr:MAG: peptide transporter [Planctomycetota bacterium]REJ92867.1 MAG: peptide transporter [Planctomycetota bacterium]